MNKSAIIVGTAADKVASDLSQYSNILTLDISSPEIRGNYHAVEPLINEATKISLADQVSWDIYNVGGEQTAKTTLVIKDEISKIQYSGVMMHKTAFGMAEQILHNMPIIARSSGINILKNHLSGKPVVIVSAGPSLEKQIETLADNQSKITILAVGQTLPVLLSNNIFPDFVCALDWTENNTFHYKYVPESTILIASTSTHRSTLDRWPGQIIFVASLFDYDEKDHNKSVFSIVNDKTQLEQGGSVANLSLSIAHYMGASPIILIGQDCALGQDGYSHCIQTVNPSEWTTSLDDNKIHYRPLNPRQCSVPARRELLAHSSPITVMTKGYYGDLVPSAQNLVSFRLTIEEFIKNHDANVINSTEGGSIIRGAENVSFDDALAKYGEVKTRECAFPAHHDETKLALGLARNDFATINEIKKCLSKIKASNFAIRKLRKGTKKYLKQANKNAKYTLSLSDACKRLPFMKMILMIGFAKCKNHTDSLDRNLALVEFIEKYFEILRDAYKIAIRKLSGDKIKPKEYGWLYDHSEFNKFSISDADEYFAYGNYSIPMLEAMELFKRDNSNTEAMSVLTKALNLRCTRVQSFRKDTSTKSIIDDII